MLLDFKDLTLTFAGAAHPPLLQLNHGTNQYIQWPSSSTFLGIMVPMPVSFESESTKMKSGQRSLLYSDGLIEIENSYQQLYGQDELSGTF
jgi:sigma-B regulation protein RsbU (phosphoserine phosphatase)